MTFVVGRADEVRIFMPFAATLAVGAVLAYRELTETLAVPADRS